VTCYRVKFAFTFTFTLRRVHNRELCSDGQFQQVSFARSSVEKDVALKEMKLLGAPNEYQETRIRNI